MKRPIFIFVAVMVTCHASAQLQPSGPLGGSGPQAPYDSIKRTRPIPSAKSPPEASQASEQKTSSGWMWQRKVPSEASQPSPSEAKANQIAQELVARCIAAEDASDVTSNLAKYVGKTFDVFGLITQTPAGPFTLAGGKGDLVGQPSANGSLACYAADAQVSKKLEYSISLLEGFRIHCFALLTVTVVQRETFPKYITVIQSGSVISPQLMGPLTRQLLERMRNLR